MLQIIQIQKRARRNLNALLEDKQHKRLLLPRPLSHKRLAAFARPQPVTGRF